MAPPPPRSQQQTPPARPPKFSPPLTTPLQDPPALPSAFRPGKGRTSTLTSPPPNLTECSTLRLGEEKGREEEELKEERGGLHSPSPPPPPSLTSLGAQDALPPPPSYSTLKRLSTYRRSDRESRRERAERMQDTSSSPSPHLSSTSPHLPSPHLNTTAPTSPSSPPHTLEQMNLTVTGAEPQSPSREAAKAAAAGWAKFHGRTSGNNPRGEEVSPRGGALRSSSRSHSVLLPPEQAAQSREQRRSRGEEVRREEEQARGEARVQEEEEAPPPLPPKPRTKISAMGCPNTEHFIVMDNSALFSRQKREGEEVEVRMEEERREKEEVRGEKSLQESHSRSDSGLSSLSSWTAVTKSGSSSVRSSSIVSDCSSKIEELLEDEGNGRTFLSTCSLRLENLVEHDEVMEKQESDEVVEHHEEQEVEQGEQEEYDDVCQSSSAVQRQLDTIRQQKSELIREIMVNEELGRGLAGRLEPLASAREQERLALFLQELEKVVLLVFSVSCRLAKAEEELECASLSDWERESRRFRREKLAAQLAEAQELRRMSDRRLARVEAVVARELGEEQVEQLRRYVGRKEELLTSQRACEDLERAILL